MKVAKRVLAAAMVAGLLVGATASADDGGKLSVTVSFGGGLNTAQPGNVHNHVVLPKQIKVKVGGVVNFVVGGFHQIVVYNSGTRPENIVLPTDPAVLFINDNSNVFYKGPSPAGPAPAGLSNTQNRVESVRFETPGTYLVICNVAPHFRDGMYAFIKVTGGDKDD
jgi:plastocyanin